MKKSAKKKKSAFLKESWNYIKLNRSYIYFVIALFVISIFLALLFPIPASLEEQLKELIKQLIERTAGLNSFQLITYIFFNNLWVSALGIFLGIIFCVAPVIIAVSNGYVMGFVIKLMMEGLGLQDGIISLWRLFPHGIFELPAVIMSLAIGIKLGVSAISSLNQNSFRILLEELKSAVKILIFVIMPLLLIAALIEGLLIGLLG